MLTPHVSDNFTSHVQGTYQGEIIKTIMELAKKIKTPGSSSFSSQTPKEIPWKFHPILPPPKGLKPIRWKG